MNRFSIHFKPNGPVNTIRMTSRFLGIPLFKVHAFFVDGLLIDTGFAYCRSEFLRLCNELHDFHTIVNTHYHEDHTGNNFWLFDKFGILPLAHPKTSLYMKAPFEWIPYYRRLVWGVPHPSEMGQVDSKIQTKQFTFLVIPTPGHAEGHICLYEPNERWLFSGDLFIGAQLRYLRKDEDIYSVLDSLKRVADLKPKRMFCSFSGIVDNPETAIHQKVEYLENLKTKIEEGLQQGLSPQEIRRNILGWVDRYRFISTGQISKQNLIDAFLRRSPQGGASRKGNFNS